MGALSSLATVGLNAALAQQAAKREAGTINTDRDRQIQAIQRRDREAKREAAERLRRQLAAQRARAGAAGVAGTGSSAEAVLRGLVEETEADHEARTAASGTQIANLRQDARTARRRNLLDRAGGATRAGLGLGNPRRSALL